MNELSELIVPGVALLGVVALFVLGYIAFRLRHKKSPPPELHAPEGTPVRRRGGQRFKKSGPYDYGPKVAQDPSSVPKFYHHSSE
ncbi:MAG: hypothetical protein Q4P15_06615 [Propionibacteriaceae bacterium]|nr:hypothetical protein [Propionibacteriaceae bacterium]